jgi:hypothetical protein
VAKAEAIFVLSFSGGIALLGSAEHNESHDFSFQCIFRPCFHAFERSMPRSLMSSTAIQKDDIMEQGALDKEEANIWRRSLVLKVD